MVEIQEIEYNPDKIELLEVITEYIKTHLKQFNHIVLSVSSGEAGLDEIHKSALMEFEDSGIALDMATTPNRNTDVVKSLTEFTRFTTKEGYQLYLHYNATQDSRVLFYELKVGINRPLESYSALVSIGTIPLVRIKATND